MVQIIIDKQNGELAFRLERFVDLSQFDHLQRKNYYSLILLKYCKPLPGLTRSRVERILQGKVRKIRKKEYENLLGTFISFSTIPVPAK